MLNASQTITKHYKQLARTTNPRLKTQTMLTNHKMIHEIKNQYDFLSEAEANRISLIIDKAQMRESEIEKLLELKDKAEKQVYGFDISFKSKTRLVSDAKSMFIGLTTERGYSQRNIGKVLNIDRSSVYAAKYKHYEIIQFDKRYIEKYEKLKTI